MSRNLTPQQAREMAALREKRAGGRPPGVTMRCEWCGEPQTAAQMRLHFTDCQKRPWIVRA